MTTRRIGWSLSLLPLLALAACDEAPAPKDLPTFGGNDAGSEVETEDDGGKPERTGPQYAVINSDWTATSVSLLGLDGTVLADDYINSASANSGLVTALSGDVEMPTVSGESGVVVLIDRYKTDVITRIRLSDAKILGQVKTHTPATQTTMNAYTSNPHDYLRIDDETAWVTRNQPNIDPSVPAVDKGNDLIRINPTTMERTGERIDLSSLNIKGTRMNFDTGKEEPVDIYAKPSRMARVGDTLVVGLSMTAFDFSAIGPGTIAVLDLKTKAVEGLELEGLKGCSKVGPIPEETERVFVGCGGEYGKTRETAGVAVVHVEKGSASVESIWRAADHDDAPTLAGSFIAIDKNTIAGSANDYEGKADSVFGTVDLEEGSFTQLLSAAATKGTFGTPLFDVDTATLFVPDSSTDADKRPVSGLRVLERKKGSFEERATVAVGEGTRMPVRHIYPL